MRPVSVLIERILRQVMIRSGDMKDPAVAASESAGEEGNEGTPRDG